MSISMVYAVCLSAHDVKRGDKPTVPTVETAVKQLKQQQLLADSRR